MDTPTSTINTRSRFKPATREKTFLRMAIDGPSGSGKSFTGLRFAFALGKKVAVIDSEHGSIKKYQGDSPDGIPWDFHVHELHTYSPTEYTAAILDAAKEGFDVLLVDSFSHAWNGLDGALEMVAKKGGNSFTAWKDVTPLHVRMVEAILSVPMHVVVTMRSKTEYVLEEDERGKKVPRKIGMAPIQRPGMEYEFDIYGSMDWSHVLTITKTRCRSIDGAVVVKPGQSFMNPVIEWLETGVVIAPKVIPALFVSDEQLGRIIDLLTKLGRSFEKEKKEIFRRYSVSEFAELTPDKAGDYEKRLQIAFEAKVKKGPGAGSGGDVASSPESSNGHQRPAVTSEAKTDNRASNENGTAGTSTATDHFRLENLAAVRTEFFSLKGLQGDPAKCDELWKQILAKRGVTTARDLTDGQLTELEANLRAACDKMYAERKERAGNPF